MAFFSCFVILLFRHLIMTIFTICGVKVRIFPSVLSSKVREQSLLFLCICFIANIWTGNTMFKALKQIHFFYIIGLIILSICIGAGIILLTCFVIAILWHRRYIKLFIPLYHSIVDLYELYIFFTYVY